MAITDEQYAAWLADDATRDDNGQPCEWAVMNRSHVIRGGVVAIVALIVMPITTNADYANVLKPLLDEGRQAGGR